MYVYTRTEVYRSTDNVLDANKRKSESRGLVVPNPSLSPRIRPACFVARALLFLLTTPFEWYAGRSGVSEKNKLRLGANVQAVVTGYRWVFSKRLDAHLLLLDGEVDGLID